MLSCVDFTTCQQQCSRRANLTLRKLTDTGERFGSISHCCTKQILLAEVYTELQTAESQHGADGRSCPP